MNQVNELKQKERLREKLLGQFKAEQQLKLSQEMEEKRGDGSRRQSSSTSNSKRTLVLQ